MAQRVEHHPLEAAFAALLNNGLDGAGEALRILVNEASRIERNHFLHAQPHERTAERTDYANGFKPKTMMTRVGELTFDVPQVRGGGFYPSALEKGARTEQALEFAEVGRVELAAHAATIGGERAVAPGAHGAFLPSLHDLLRRG